ncbi:glycoside hydrolase family 3 C-terminal domain-containing protein [Vagococcus sp. BWB3-3]|uniref:Glycoside hydrolase family 3 C-terminal domain-containing protein n=1 Tax=Vagococcus allomyrinae TaxID=2794353 RepID=A0A940STG9_9ENTE|nr:glycoside hydrolase family 3 N-terminal domain-containing protein [Vagococcus allomyrinae]MBP1039674.1 glycoside hydrolase family 3 C-terminal domain-containing protein [Vagococcus allomyrinae]
MKVKQLLQQMTLKEKVGQLNQRLYGWEVYTKKEGEITLTKTFKEEVDRWGSLGFIYGVFRADPWSGKNQETGLSTEEARYVSHLIQEYLQEHTRLKIPVFLSEECPHGHQGLESLTTAANISVGASWNPALYQEVQEIVARDIREKGAHLGLISTLDIARDPRWGRTEECFSEDPFLASQFTVAALKGLQGGAGQRIDEAHVLAVLKHFAGQGSAMGGHNSGPVNIGPRELREIHLPPMVAGIANGAQMTMAAYNDVDGQLCHGNPDLLNRLLREELGFQGAVMADGCALDRLVEITEDKVEAAIWAVTSGVDISLWDDVYPYLEEAVVSGRLSEEVIDTAVLRVLLLKEKMGLFSNPTPLVQSASLEEKRERSVQLAKESLVLLKNQEHRLPLKKNETIAVIGPNGDLLYNQLGDYTPYKCEEQCVTVLKGIQDYGHEHGMTVVSAPGSMITRELEGGIEEAVALAKTVDTVVLVLGGSSARDFSTTFDANGAALSGSNEMTSGENIDLADLALPAAQVKLVKALHDVKKTLIGVFIQGRPHILTAVEPYLDAILIGGYPGEYGGEAIASILFEESPSGKLAMSLPRSNGQLPVYYNYRDVAFKEAYGDDSGKPLYSFGTGLSYTSFSLTDLALVVPTKAGLHKGESLKISGTIKNTGDYRGAEVIQVYLKSHPKKLVTRVKELKGFCKIWLDPKETKGIELNLNLAELSELAENMNTQMMTDITVMVEAHDFSWQERIRIND